MCVTIVIAVVVGRSLSTVEEEVVCCLLFVVAIL